MKEIKILVIHLLFTNGSNYGKFMLNASQPLNPEKVLGMVAHALKVTELPFYFSSCGDTLNVLSVSDDPENMKNKFMDYMQQFIHNKSIINLKLSDMNNLNSSNLVIFEDVRDSISMYLQPTAFCSLDSLLRQITLALNSGISHTMIFRWICNHLSSRTIAVENKILDYLLTLK